jgi:hypothetical protein
MKCCFKEIQYQDCLDGMDSETTDLRVRDAWPIRSKKAMNIQVHQEKYILGRGHRFGMVGQCKKCLVTPAERLP